MENIHVCRWPEIPKQDHLPFHEFILLKLAETNSDENIIIDGVTGEGFSHHQLIQSSKNVASGLHRHGLGKRDVLLMVCQNNIHYPIVFLATAINGATFSMVNHDYNARELLYHLNDSKASMVVCHENVADVIKEACRLSGENRKIFVIGKSEGCIPFQELMDDDRTSYPKFTSMNLYTDTCILPYSSGTTGLPKGVMLSHSALVAIMNAAVDPIMFSLHPDDTVMCFMPTYHIFGFFIMAAALCSQVKFVMVPKFNPHTFLSAMEKYQVTILPIVPPVVLFMAQYKDTDKYDLSHIRVVLCGAAPLPPDVQKNFEMKFPQVQEFRQGYGMTETAFLSHMQYEGSEFKMGSIGSLIPFTQAKIIDLSTGVPLGPHKEGELCLRGDGIMIGYHNNKKATDETIDTDSWLHTGDVGYYDDDGDFFIVDRIKELIKHKGFQVAPAELEALLLTHKSVKDAAVIGVPDKMAGESARAYIVTQPHTLVTEQEIVDFVAKNLSRHKHLHGGVVFVDEIPKSPTGKILRLELRNKATEHWRIQGRGLGG